MQDNKGKIITEKNNPYNYLIYGLAITFIIESVLLFYPPLVSCGVTYWGEILLLLGTFVFGCIYNKIDFELRIQPMFLIVLFWGIWVLSYIKWDMEKPIDTRLYLIGLFSLSWVVIRQMIDIASLRRNIFSYVRNNIPIFVLILICFSLTVPTINDICFYDCGQYYRNSVNQIGISTFDYSFDNIRDYCFCGHTTSGFALFVILGELLNKTYGFRIANYFLYLVSILCFYKCVRKLTNATRVSSTLATAVYAFSPWCLGLIGQTSIDNPSLYFIPILLFAYLFRRDVLLLLVGWLFVNTKESNVVYYSIFAFSIWVMYVVQKNKETHKWSGDTICRILQKGVLLVIPSIMWLVMYAGFTRTGGWLSSVGNSGVENVVANPAVSEAVNRIDINAPLEEYVHTVGFTWANFAQKNREMFVYNFSWLWILLAIVSFGIIVYRNQKQKLNNIFRDELLKYIPILAIILSIAIFNWIYLDWDNPRYVMPMVAPLLLITTCCVLRGGRKYSYNIILVIGAVLMLVQSFVFIDPSMAVKSINMSHKDEGMYNRNYRALYVCLNKIMDDIDWEGDYISIRLGEGLCSYGEEIYYDRDTKRVTLSEKSANSTYISYRIDGDCDYYVYDLSREEIPNDLQEIERYSYSNMKLGLFIEK